MKTYEKVIVGILVFILGWIAGGVQAFFSRHKHLETPTSYSSAIREIDQAIMEGRSFTFLGRYRFIPTREPGHGVIVIMTPVNGDSRYFNPLTTDWAKEEGRFK